LTPERHAGYGLLCAVSPPESDPLGERASESSDSLPSAGGRRELSRWSFHAWLDDLVASLKAVLMDSAHRSYAEVPDFGLAILYRGTDRHGRVCAFVGGVIGVASRDRHTIPLRARYYDLEAVPARQPSFTQFAFTRRAEFQLDDFKSATARFAPHIEHVQKGGETDRATPRVASCS
jgi:hypothetical protein